MGRGSQLTAWDPEFCRELADRGYYVIRYDHRDVGLSTWLDDVYGDDADTRPYSISDMADDAAGLLDALKIDSTHVVGYPWVD